MDAGPSTSPPHDDEENWDDDFVFQANGTGNPHAPVKKEEVLTPVTQHRESIAWDDPDDASPLRRDVPPNDSLSPTKWTDDEEEDAFETPQDMDKTVTIRSGVASTTSLPNSQSQSYHPHSPTMSSTFSMGASSTAHVALLRSPPSRQPSLLPSYAPPPPTRPRRRLKKKTRPPGDVFEMEEKREGFQEELEEDSTYTYRTSSEAGHTQTYTHTQATTSGAGPSAHPTSSSLRHKTTTPFPRPQSPSENAHYQASQSKTQTQPSTSNRTSSSRDRGRVAERAGSASPPLTSNPGSPSVPTRRLGSMRSSWQYVRSKKRESDGEMGSGLGLGLEKMENARTSPTTMFRPREDATLGRKGSLTSHTSAEGRRRGKTTLAKVLGLVTTSPPPSTPPSKWQKVLGMTPPPRSKVMGLGIGRRPTSMQPQHKINRSTSSPYLGLTPDKETGKPSRHQRNRSTGAEMAPKLPALPVGLGLLTPARERPSAPSSDVSASTPHTPSPPQPDLLPPIEFSPPSPPHMLPSLSTPAHSGFINHGSLGRANGAQVQAMSAALRRNSLGDLKIPARISKAQAGLKSNLTMVREFASTVEELKTLQDAYKSLLKELEEKTGLGEDDLLGAGHGVRPPGDAFIRKSSLPTLDSLVIHPAVEIVRKLGGQYALWWECADVLIELGGGAQSQASPKVEDEGGEGDGEVGNKTEPTIVPPPPPSSYPGKHRERAITLGGSDVTTRPSVWRSSTGRTGLSQRQLVLLREMLTTPDPSTLSLPDYRAPPPPKPRWNADLKVENQRERDGRQRLSGRFASSAVTLPESSASSSLHATPILPPPPLPKRPNKLRRGSRTGFTSLKDMLRSLTRSSAQPSSTSVDKGEHSGSSSTDLQVPVNGLPPPPSGKGFFRRSGKSSTGAHSVVEAERSPPQQPPRPFSSQAARKSPRRPGLAGLFKMGSKDKKLPPTTSSAAETTTEDDLSDWDRMDSASDLEGRESREARRSREGTGGHLGKEATETQRSVNQGTVKGRKPSMAMSAPPTMPAYAIPAASRSSLSLRGSPKYHPSHLSASIAEEGQTPPPMKVVSSTQRPGRTPRNRQATNSSLPPMPTKSMLGNSTTREESPPPSEPPNVMLTPRPANAAPAVQASPRSLTDIRLAMTPENIKPLLECSKEVSMRLNDCVTQLRGLAAATSMSS